MQARRRLRLTTLDWPACLLAPDHRPSARGVTVEERRPNGAEATPSPPRVRDNRQSRRPAECEMMMVDAMMRCSH